MGEPRPGRRREVGAGSLTGTPSLFDDPGASSPVPLGATPPDASRARPDPGVASGPADLVVRVLPDETGLGKTFDYTVPVAWVDQIRVGTRVRIALGPRRVGAWVVAVGVEPHPGVRLRPIAKVSGYGPSPTVLALSEWAAWRWAARTPVPFLRTASPERVVTALPAAPARRGVSSGVEDPVVSAAFAGPGVSVLRLPPAEDLLPVVVAASRLGDALVLCPSRAVAGRLAARLRRTGTPVAVHPEDWGQAAAGGRVVIGTRAAAWAPGPDLASIVVLDEHDEAYQEEGSPTWHARDVAVERADRAGIPCVLTSAMPSLEALAAGSLVRPDRARERSGWPVTEIIDRREDDAARNALFSPRLVDLVRAGARVACVLNEKGRAALLACRSCAALARCSRCGSAVHKPDGALECRRCGESRPVVCASCGGLNLRTVRVGVSRVRDDLAVLAGEDVLAVTAETPLHALDRARLHVGTEALLHQVETVDVVAFLDFDQELLAARYRAAEEALALVVRAGRLVGGRHGPSARGGRVLLQTRLPDHEVCRASLLGDPSRLAEVEADRRVLLGYPPARALAVVGGPAAGPFVERLRSTPGAAALDLIGPVDGQWRITAPDQRTLCDVLATVERPHGRLRLALDPMRI